MIDIIYFISYPARKLGRVPVPLGIDIDIQSIVSLADIEDGGQCRELISNHNFLTCTAIANKPPIRPDHELVNYVFWNYTPPLENWQKSYQNGEYIRSAESGEEANYNMVDGLHNNSRKRKRGKKRRSVLKRLHEKQMEMARREKRVPQQNLPHVMQEQEHEIEQKPRNN